MTREELIQEFNKAPNYDDDMLDEMKTRLKLAIIQEDWDMFTEMMRFSVRKTREECADIALSRERLLLEKIGKLTNAISAIQMLIEEDIEERKGFTFNRKKILDIAEEALK